MTSRLTSQFFFFFFFFSFFARTATHVWARTYGHALVSIIPAISVCVSVCLRPLFLDNHWSDLIETCQVYCWGPVDVAFQGLILIRQVVPKLWPFIYQTNDRTRCYDVTIDVTILLLFFFFFFFCTHGHSRTGTHARAHTSIYKCSIQYTCIYYFC